jgi:malonyl CoA-acyl carrier protein transacylase
VAFVFCGQGPQWYAMGRELFGDEPVFRDALLACDALIKSRTGWSLIDELTAEETASRLDLTAVAQPAIFAIQVALAALWNSWGIVPSAVVGHSVGEIAALHVAGSLTLDEAVRIVCERGAIMQRAAGGGRMAAASITAAEAQALVQPYGDRLSIGAINSPRGVTLSGEPVALEEALAELDARGVSHRALTVNFAFHSAQMAPCELALASALGNVVASAPQVSVYSTVAGRRADDMRFDAAYFGRNVRATVQLAAALDAIIADGIDAFLEIGPHPVLSMSIAECLEARGTKVPIFASLRRGRPERETMLQALAGAYAAGCAPRWESLGPATTPVTLPPYPWQRERHWHAAAEPVLRGGAHLARLRPTESAFGWLYAMQWEPAPRSASEADAPPGSWLVVGLAAEGERLATSLRARGGEVRAVTPDSLAEGLTWLAQLGEGSPAIVLIAEDAANAAFAPIALVQAVTSRAWKVSPRLWFVTRGAQGVNATERVSVWQGALWGAARVVAEEHPELWGGLVDCAGEGGQDDATPLACTLLTRDGEDQVAIRDGQRLVLRLASLSTTGVAAAAPRWRADASYLITGGLGDIGLRIAASMVDAGARRLVLLGRTPLPPRTQWSSLPADSRDGRRAAAVRALEAKGAAVHLLSADVGDAAQLGAALDAYAAEGWPPIRGVVHAAGSLDNRLAGEMDTKVFDRVVVPKLHGAVHLDRLLPDLDLFVLFSSTGAFLAQPGQANYAAANAGLDAFARDRCARGRHALSIAWGVWAGTGIVRDRAGGRNVEELKRQGVQAFDPEQGVALFGWLLSRVQRGVTVLPVSWPAFKRARGGRDFPLFRAQLAAAQDEDVDGTSDFAVRLREARSPAKRRQLVAEGVRETAAQVLRRAPARIDGRRTLGSMGLDSLMALEFRNRLEGLFARSLPATLLWNYPSLDALAAFLSDDAPTLPVPSSPMVERADALSESSLESDGDIVVALADLTAVSDADITRALRAK